MLITQGFKQRYLKQRIAEQELSRWYKATDSQFRFASPLLPIFSL